MDGKPDETKYCQEWLTVLGIQQSLTYGTSFLIMGVNVVMCMILSAMVAFEKHHTKNDETMSQFIRITIL